MEEYRKGGESPSSVKAEETDYRLIVKLFRFWSFIDTEYSKITEKAINTLLSFSTTCLCKPDFSALPNH